MPYTVKIERHLYKCFDNKSRKDKINLNNWDGFSQIPKQDLNFSFELLDQKKGSLLKISYPEIIVSNHGGMIEKEIQLLFLSSISIYLS